MNKIIKNIDPIKLALLAVGGDGGGVLTTWITELAERNGYYAQYTYIAGVAQRTGATVYYMELFPEDKISRDETPILSQMPSQQDVDILLATELMEAGRAVQRGFVSKKTTMIFSTNRNLSISEKEHAGDGILDGEQVFKMTNKYAKQSLFGNLKLIAGKNGSVISSSLFGALAASGALPFKKQAYIDIIQLGGKGIEQSINAFNEAYQYVKDFMEQPKPYVADLQPATFKAMPSSSESTQLQTFIDEIKDAFPEPVWDIAWHAVNQLQQFQNIDYAKEYLEKIKPVLAIDQAEKNYLLTQRVAFYLANAMGYDDLIYVADEKTKKSRQVTVYQQIGAKEDEIVNTLDYLRPGYEELVGFMPVGIGKRLRNNKKWHKRYDKYFNKDRRMHSTGLFGFLLLYFIGGLRGWRLKTLRHHDEMTTINAWLHSIKKAQSVNYDLAVAVANVYRLKKGYSDTYNRGHSKFSMINDFAMANINVDDIDEKITYLTAYALQNHDANKTKQMIEELH